MTTSKPAPLHTDSMAYAARVNDGKIPEGWSEAVSEGVAQANVIAALAWEKVRDPRDPPFVACSFSHREKLVATVESILKVGPPNEAATPFTDAAVALVAEINKYLNRLRLTGETEGDN